MTQLVLPDKAKSIINKLKQHGFEAYVVGGFIRNQLLKREENQVGIDFTTNATPEQIITIFKEAKYENRFGTVIVPLKNHDYVEITTYRTEHSYSDCRHPDEIKWGKTLEEDLERRDFTINALCYDGKHFVDLYNGRRDLEKKLVRTIGKPEERFKEDALRLIRAVRFSSELGFTIEPQTLKAIIKNAKLLELISNERIRDEFLKILVSKHAADGVMLLKHTGLLAVFLPELVEAFNIDQISPQRHHIYNLGTHLVKTLAECRNLDPIVRLASLLHDIGKIKTRAITKEGVVTFYNHEVVGTEMVYEIGNRLKLSKKQLYKLTKLVRYHQFTVSELQTEKALRRFINNVDKENLQDIIDLRFADRVGSGAKPTSWRTELFLKRLQEVQKQPFKITDLKINGQDVMKTLKLKPEPKVGQILKRVFEAVENQELTNDRKSLLTYLKKLT